MKEPETEGAKSISPQPHLPFLLRLIWTLTEPKLIKRETRKSHRLSLSFGLLSSVGPGILSLLPSSQDQTRYMMVPKVLPSTSPFSCYPPWESSFTTMGRTPEAVSPVLSTLLSPGSLDLAAYRTLLPGCPRGTIKSTYFKMEPFPPYFSLSFPMMVNHYFVVFKQGHLEKRVTFLLSQLGDISGQGAQAAK